MCQGIFITVLVPGCGLLVSTQDLPLFVHMLSLGMPTHYIAAAEVLNQYQNRPMKPVSTLSTR